MESSQFLHSDIPYRSRITPELKVLHGDELDLSQLPTYKENKIPLIGTHSEVFHCDEVLATTMLLYTKEF